MQVAAGPALPGEKVPGARARQLARDQTGDRVLRPPPPSPSPSPPLSTPAQGRERLPGAQAAEGNPGIPLPTPYSRLVSRNRLLAVLHLESNNLTRLDSNCFGGMRAMQWLYFDHNQIAVVGRQALQAFQAMGRIGGIHLRGNRCSPVHCIALPPTPGWQRSTSKC